MSYDVTVGMYGQDEPGVAKGCSVIPRGLIGSETHRWQRHTVTY